MPYLPNWVWYAFIIILVVVALAYVGVTIDESGSIPATSN